MTDRELIEQYLKGDNRALDILIENYLKIIYNFVYRNVGSQTDAEDITQEVFVKVWKNLKKFDINKKFKPWIFQIAKNTSIDFLRKKKSIPFSKFENEKGQNPLVENTASPPLNLIEKLSDKRAVATILAGLNDQEQKIITFRHIEGMSFNEIAEMFKKPVNTIKSQYRRIILKLKGASKRI